MNQKAENKNSRLIPILREGVAVIQMIFFKEMKQIIASKHADLDLPSQTMLAGAITNEIFGTHNLEEKFQIFREQHKGAIEQELLSLSTELPQLIGPLADALRIQTLCDNQEGIDSSHVLKLADSCNLLPMEQELPLPSAFMDKVRHLGGHYNLVIPPVEINATEEQNLLQ